MSQTRYHRQQWWPRISAGERAILHQAGQETILITVSAVQTTTLEPLGPSLQSGFLSYHKVTPRILI